MIKFFRIIRQKLLSENKYRLYLFYAIGEIILVVIGILIALQVNNWNIDRIDRKREIKYLKNIILDLKKDISNLDFLINFRKQRILGDQNIIDHINGAPINDMTKLTKNVVFSLMEQRFTPNNGTYTELANSGNLSLISNESIKILLLELNKLYKMNEFLIAHEEFEYREFISKSLYKYSDLNKLLPVYIEENTTENQNITKNEFNALFKSNEYKNGLVILIFMHKGVIPQYEDIMSKSQKLIDMIKIEIGK